MFVNTLLNKYLIFSKNLYLLKGYTSQKSTAVAEWLQYLIEQRQDRVWIAVRSRV